MSVSAMGLGAQLRTLSFELRLMWGSEAESKEVPAVACTQ